MEHYYDAGTAEELVYRIGAAHAEYIHGQVCRFRRGFRGDEASSTGTVRRTKGHILWKFNNNSNIISYGIVDYYQEPYYPYYELKRCYSPFLVSCELGDHGYIWVTNDTGGAVSGRLEIFLFDIVKNERQAVFYEDFQAEPDESKPVCTIDRFGQFKKSNLVCAVAYSEAKFWECVRSRVRLNEEWSTRNIRGFRSGRREMTLSSLRAGLPDA